MPLKHTTRIVICLIRQNKHSQRKQCIACKANEGWGSGVLHAPYTSKTKIEVCNSTFPDTSNFKNINKMPTTQPFCSALRTTYPQPESFYSLQVFLFQGSFTENNFVFQLFFRLVTVNGFLKDCFIIQIKAVVAQIQWGNSNIFPLPAVHVY